MIFKDDGSTELLRNSNEDLLCRLSAEEWADRAQQLATAQGELEQFRARKADTNAALAAEEKRISFNICKLGMSVRSKSESREVQCELRADYRSGRAIIVRLDTGEVVRERPLLPEERQAHVPGTR